ncbi:MAG: hypothetical protein JSU91_03755 [Thermoplasmatales archaeon]|nr:MAG: hypothetical protein JSU91_03755 [Thermoplasmatales archaeon]
MNLKKLIKFSIKLLILMILIAGSIGSAVLAIWTVVPDSSASKESILGYKSHCSFTPISTIILVFIAIVFTYLLIRTKFLGLSIPKI